MPAPGPSAVRRFFQTASRGGAWREARPCAGTPTRHVPRAPGPLVTGMGTGMHVPPAVPQSTGRGSPARRAPPAARRARALGHIREPSSGHRPEMASERHPGPGGCPVLGPGRDLSQNRWSRGTGQSPGWSWAQGRPAGSGGSSLAQENPGDLAAQPGAEASLQKASRGFSGSRSLGTGRPCSWPGEGAAHSPARSPRRPQRAVPAAHLLAPGSVRVVLAAPESHCPSNTGVLLTRDPLRHPSSKS